MTVGALVDAGADWPALEFALHSLRLSASFRVEKTARNRVAASKFTIENGDSAKHRHFTEIEKIIAAGEMPKSARQNAIDVFRSLGEAEAKSHNVPFEKVHFHEIGAVDSICDIVGACVALDLLGVDEVSSSEINVGSGSIQTAHGRLPVPAPATAELLNNLPIYSAGPQAELTTPTGAALLKTLARNFGPMPTMRITSQGFGAGDRDFPNQANVLRVLIGERTDVPESTSVYILEANIDDSTPQVLGYTLERLLENGALDVTLTPVFMKKNRPATMISAIAAPEFREQLVSTLFAETSTLGVRILRAERRVLPRRTIEIDTSFGKIGIKYTDNGTFAPEFDDCRRAAAQHSVPLRAVIAEANQAFRKLQPNHS